MHPHFADYIIKTDFLLFRAACSGFIIQHYIEFNIPNFEAKHVILYQTGSTFKYSILNLKSYIQ